MANITAHIATFNCARTAVSVDHLAAQFFSALRTDLPPDLIVLCLQEVAPISHAFLGGSFLTPYFNELARAVYAAAARLNSGDGQPLKYEAVTARNVGMTAIMVFATSSTRDRISWLETGGVGVGVWDMGNKGGVGVRLGVEGRGGDVVPVTFVSAHLAPAEDAWERRNEDWAAINSGLVFTREADVVSQKEDGQQESEPLLAGETGETRDASAQPCSIFSPPSHIFFAGDLNYRTSDTPPQPQENLRWPEPAATTDMKKYSPMFKSDQLTREMEAKHAFHNLAEAPVTFPPTYKYSNMARLQAGKGTASSRPASVGAGEPWQWARHRVPSWCDRILFLERSKAEVHGYDALPVQPTSDHRPVTLSVSIPMQSPASVKSPFSINPDWETRRAAARRYEVIVGVAAYLTLTWEGEALLAGTLVGVLGGWIALRALLGV